jgi:hypothetical protein
MVEVYRSFIESDPNNPLTPPTGDGLIDGEYVPDTDDRIGEVTVGVEGRPVPLPSPAEGV